MYFHFFHRWRCSLLLQQHTSSIFRSSHLTARLLVILLVVIIFSAKSSSSKRALNENNWSEQALDVVKVGEREKAMKKVFLWFSLTAGSPAIPQRRQWRMSVVAWDKQRRKKENVYEEERKKFNLNWIFISSWHRTAARGRWCEELKQPEHYYYFIKDFFIMQHTQWIIHELSVWHNVKFFRAREERKQRRLWLRCTQFMFRWKLNLLLPSKIVFCISTVLLLLLHSPPRPIACRNFLGPLAAEWICCSWSCDGSRASRYRFCRFTRFPTLLSFSTIHMIVTWPLSSYILHTLDSTMGRCALHWSCCDMAVSRQREIENVVEKFSMWILCYCYIAGFWWNLWEIGTMKWKSCHQQAITL